MALGGGKTKRLRLAPQLLRHQGRALKAQVPRVPQVQARRAAHQVLLGPAAHRGVLLAAQPPVR